MAKMCSSPPKTGKMVEPRMGKPKSLGYRTEKR